MDTTNGILADKKQGQFVTKSQIPDPPVSPPSPLWPHSPCALLFAVAKVLPPDSEILVFLLGVGAQILYQKVERLKPKGLQAQKVRTRDAISEHREHRPGSEERSWLGSPIILWTECGLLLPIHCCPGGSPVHVNGARPPSQGRVGEGTLTQYHPPPAGLAHGTAQRKLPASALKEGDLPLTWALSISVWDVKAVTSLSLLFSLSCRPGVKREMRGHQYSRANTAVQWVTGWPFHQNPKMGSHLASRVQVLPHSSGPSG